MISSPVMGSFPSFSQTGPSDLHGPAWESAVEGTQNFADFHEGAGDAYSTFSLGHVSPTQGEEDFQSKWTMSTAQEAAPAVVGSAPMRRITSRSSAGSRRPLSRASSKAGRRLRVTLAQAPQLSYEQLAGNATIMTGASQFLGMDSPMHVSAQGFYPGITSAAYSPDALAYGSLASAPSQHVNPTCTQMDFEPGLMGNSPQSWDSCSSAFARTPSPVATDDAWIAPRLATSPTDTTSSSPLFQAQSPRISRKYDIQAQLDAMEGFAGNFPDHFALPPSFAPTTRSSGADLESPRDHHWYKAAPNADDGLYHCPLEGQDNCNHKPEKLKCNYDKYVDSHLRPYRCKQEACENTQFSSTACLLRHEREAHGMHGHGAKPFMCTFEGCDRAQPGNGFPRQWNLKDHMKRVHNEVPAPQASYSAGASQPASSSSQAQVKNRKRKKDVAEAVVPSSSRKSSSSSPKVQAQPQLITPAPSPPSKAEERSTKAAEKWYSHQQRLVDVFAGFTHPEDPNMLEYLRDAQSQLDAMTKISSGLLAKRPRKNSS